MNILVTRPKGRADELATELLALGHKVFHYPVLAIEPLADEQQHAIQACKNTVMALDSYQHCIFVSVNAVIHGMQWIENYWPQLPLDIQYYAIGQATAEELARYDIQCLAAGQYSMNSEELLASTHLQQLDGEKILIVRGLGGRTKLKQTLEQRGAVVDYLECYQRVMPRQQDADIALADYIKQHAISAIVINSGETLTNFCQLCGPELAQFYKLPLILPSPRVAELAINAGFSTIITAQNAGKAATLEALSTLN